MCSPGFPFLLGNRLCQSEAANYSSHLRKLKLLEVFFNIYIKEETESMLLI